MRQHVPSRPAYRDEIKQLDDISVDIMEDRRPVRGPGAWISSRDRSIWLIVLPLVIVGAAMAWNLQGYPGPINDDEGTYTAQAWAIVTQHRLAPYTYWYDHPPFGWITIAVWARLTDGFNRLPRAVMVSREVMWIATLASSVFLYVYAQRIGLRRVNAAGAVVLFGLSPLDIWYHRMVSLDNLATMWALAAFTIAASKRKSVASAFWSGFFFAGASLSKETIILLFPALLWQLRRSTEKSTRLWNISVFVTTYVLICTVYPLFAVLRGELLPGNGHVSLAGSVMYQFVTRTGTGSVLDPNSGTFALVHSWIILGSWLSIAGVLVLPVALFNPRLRPGALALLLQLAVLVKGGYVPYAFVTAMLPFEALLLAGTIDLLWGRANHPHRRHRGDSRFRQLSVLSRLLAIAIVVMFAVFALPHWAGFLVRQSSYYGFFDEQAATQWVINNVPKGDIVAVDDYPWTDIAERERAIPLWIWKIDSDPQVMRQQLPLGYRSISYMELDLTSGDGTESALIDRPTLLAAIRHARVIRKFGNIFIYKIVG